MMASKPTPPSGHGRPSPREAVAKVQAAAGPAVARAQAKAAPKVEAAAAKAGSLLGSLRDRAKETAKGFTDGYGVTGDAPSTESAAPAASKPPATEDPQDAAPRPRPRPR